MQIEEIQKKTGPLLVPFSWAYALGVRIRNFLFDHAVLKSERFPMPVICVGNISVGGTGKTPHTEYITELLRKKGLKVGILSRGYKRTTKGFILANASSTADEIGDEPCQMKMLYPGCAVAVDESRVNGIRELMKLSDPMLDAIILDDAFQHRYVQPGLSIILTDYNNLFTEDKLLPAGTLREDPSESKRAQVIIVTKCPQNIKPIDFNITRKRLHLHPYQDLYFTSIRYKAIRPLFEEGANTRLKERTHILLLTGIANPEPLFNHVREYCQHLEMMTFEDHHNFTQEDFYEIKYRFDNLQSKDKMIVTTSKDAARLATSPFLPQELKKYIFTQGIEIKFLQNTQDDFNNQILDYVKKDSRNR